MSEQITINLTQPKEEIKFSYTEQGEEITFSFSEAARGPQGEPGSSVTVDQTIIDGSTNAVSGNAVFDGLALKAPINNPTFTGIVTAPRITGRCDGLEVFCKAGLSINAGQVVYVTGAAGNNIIIGLAQANAEPTSSKTIGISESTLAHNATGYAITEGLMTVSISAPTAVEGDPIWLSPTTAGGMVFGSANKPSAPNHIVYLGVVTRKTGNTVVEIYVKIQNGAELEELADVAITSPVAGQALMRGATLWENRSLVSADISDAKSSGAGAADAGKLVEFGSQGQVAFTGVNTATAISAISNSGSGAEIGSTSGIGAQISSSTNIGLSVYSNTTAIDSSSAAGIALISSSNSNTGARSQSLAGTNHHEFGITSGNDRSFVRRVLGLFGWHRGSFVQTLGSPSTLTANSAIELPDIASGTIALTSDARFTDERVPTAAGLTSKFSTADAAIIDADRVAVFDSTASDAPKHVLWSLIVSTLTTAFNSLYVGLTGNQTVAGNKTFSGQISITNQVLDSGSKAVTRDTMLSNRVDPVNFSIKDDFLNSNSVTQTIGELGWDRFSSGGGTGATIFSPTTTLPQVGLKQLVCGNATNAGQTMYLPSLIGMLTTTNWIMTFVQKIDQTTDCDFICGFTKDNAAIGIGKFGGISFGARYSSAFDTNFMFYSKNTNIDFAANDSNNFAVSSGVAVNTNYNTIRMRSTSIGAVEMNINNGSWVSLNLSSIATSGSFIPFFYISTRTTATKAITVDYFSMKIEQLSR